MIRREKTTEEASKPFAECKVHYPNHISYLMLKNSKIVGAFTLSCKRSFMKFKNKKGLTIFKKKSYLKKNENWKNNYKNL
jgi:hypothetical protein